MPPVSLRYGPDGVPSNEGESRMTTREDFEASADQWIRQLRHFCDSAAREIEQLDKLIEGASNPEDYIKRQEDPRQRLAEFAKASEAAVSMTARVLAHWPTDWPPDL